MLPTTDPLLIRVFPDGGFEIYDRRLAHHFLMAKLSKPQAAATDEAAVQLLSAMSDKPPAVPCSTTMFADTDVRDASLAEDIVCNSTAGGDVSISVDDVLYQQDPWRDYMDRRVRVPFSHKRISGVVVPANAKACTSVEFELRQEFSEFSAFIGTQVSCGRDPWAAYSPITAGSSSGISWGGLGGSQWARLRPWFVHGVWCGCGGCGAGLWSICG